MASAKAAASGKAVRAATVGKQAKTDVPASVFGEPFNESLVHEVAVAEMNARRRGTHSTLTRGEVAMTGAKAWKQKGTGRARAGALSVPHRKGGGAAFGPKPRHYIAKVNRKARRTALRSALSVHAERGSLAVLPAGSFDQPQTKQAAQALEKLAARMPAVVVVTADEAAAAKSFRNIPRVVVSSAEGVGVAEIVGCRSLIVSEPSLEVLERRSAPVSRKGGGESDPAEAKGDSGA